VTDSYTTADILWDDNQQPLSRQFDDVYFSKTNGLEESRFVFIGKNALLTRWQQPLPQEQFTIGETGFGTGLNFLAAWALWDTLQPKTINGQHATLHFISVEKYPLSSSDLQRALSLWPELNTFSQALVGSYPPQPASGVHRLMFAGGRVVLTLIFDDATAGFSQLLAQNIQRKHNHPSLQLGIQRNVIDAWFLDGFAPAKNPEMWTPELFETMAQLSHQDTTFSTFTAAGSVKRGLLAANFRVEKVPGFGKKREMLSGRFTAELPIKIGETPQGLFWHCLPTREMKKSKTAIVIGGGLAGCHAAFALSRRGIQVTLLERHTQLANEASGNRQGVLYTRLSPHNDSLSQFNLSAQLFASRFYHQQFSSFKKSLFQTCGAACGVLHLALKEKQHDYFQRLAARFEAKFCVWLDQKAASDHAGVPLKAPGLLLPDAGWLMPARVCEHLVSGANIQVLTGWQAGEIESNGPTWSVSNTAKSVTLNADIVVIANAQSASQFEQTAHLPLRLIRGQVSHLPIPPTLQSLRTVLCGEGYVAPAIEDTLCVGASFNLGDTDPNLNTRDQLSNIDNLKQMIALEALAGIDHLAGRVGFRTTTPDYFPMVGPAPKASEFCRDFEPLRFKANASIDLPGPCHHGLFTLLGLGSRGIAYAPLAAEVLASLVCGEPLPLAQSLYQHLHPGRFLIRDLMRNKAV